MPAEQNNVTQKTATDKTNTFNSKWYSLCVIAADHISFYKGIMKCYDI